MDTLSSRTLANLLGVPLVLHIGHDDETKRVEPAGHFVARQHPKIEPQITSMGAVPVIYYSPARLSNDALEMLERYRGHAVIITFSDVAHLMAVARQADWRPLNIAVLTVDPRTRHGLSLLGAVENARRLELHGFV